MLLPNFICPKASDNRPICMMIFSMTDLISPESSVIRSNAAMNGLLLLFWHRQMFSSHTIAQEQELNKRVSFLWQIGIEPWWLIGTEPWWLMIQDRADNYKGGRYSQLLGLLRSIEGSSSHYLESWHVEPESPWFVGFLLVTACKLNPSKANLYSVWDYKAVNTRRPLIQLCSSWNKGVRS